MYGFNLYVDAAFNVALLFREHFNKVKIILFHKF